MSIAETSAPRRATRTRHLTGAGRQVEDPLARLDGEPLDQLVLHRRKPRRQTLVRALAPDLTHPVESILLPVGDLFSEAANRRLGASAPLAQRLRPLTLDDFAGQEHVIGRGRALRLAIEQDRVPSMILYGPPGSGKTTLARIVAQTTGAEFEELSAVSATVSNVREVLARARERLGASGRADDPLPRRDPPLQQGAAGCAAARCRGWPADADRRDDGEPLLRGQLRAPVTHTDLRARAALDRHPAGGRAARRTTRSRSTSRRRWKS